MIDVHPPHEPIHTWRSFFIHLVTITVGLLIALGLEGLLEVEHNRHLLHQAESNLSDEMHENRDRLASDERQLGGAEEQIAHNLNILAALRTRTKPSQQLQFRWEWNGLEEAAWDTARNTGAVTLMPYFAAQQYSEVYRQQSIVDNQSTVFIRDIYRSAVPLQGGRKLSELKPNEIDAMTAAQQQTLVDIKYLRDLSGSLDQIYARAAHLQ